MQDHDIRPLYYDVAGQPMDKAEWLKAYPTRVEIRRTVLGHFGVTTYFVGIDHSQASERAALINNPQIYETVSGIVVEGAVVLRSAVWSGGFRRAKLWHWLAVAFGCVGGAVWWRYCAYRKVQG